MKESKLASNRKIAGVAFSTAALMLVLAFGFVPLYDIFCDITGFAGTPKISKKLPTKEFFSEKIKIRFDANVDKELFWKFKPDVREIDAYLGQQFTISYVAKNMSKNKSMGISSFNVTPNKAAQYFTKIECFCFQEQLLEPGESMSMPVTFYVDPEIINDKYAKEVKTITLSYTFFKSLDDIPEIDLEKDI